jgi:ABC-2 type transport system ATP-binding protein
MADDVIAVEGLRKTYKRAKRKWLFFKEKEERIEALKGISFRVKEGEIVALLGPNGSGKSTTTKILTGVLHPDGGKAEVLGHTPWKREREYLKQIGVIFGQRSALIWDVPVEDTFLLYKDMYNVRDDNYQETLEFLDKHLKIKELLPVQARKLSLGQRMRCELGLILLHRPRVIFLDEPTIGIDVWTREKIKEMLKKVREEWGSTIVYTTHQMSDIEGLVERVILLDNGKIVFDGSVRELRRTVPYKFLSVEFAGDVPELPHEVMERAGNYIKYRVPRSKAKDAVEQVLKHEITDLSLEEPDLEAVLKEVLKE